MYHFHTLIRVTASAPAAGVPITCHGVTLQPRKLEPVNLRPFAVSFEETADRLSQLPRMQVELDGAFVWVASEDPSWQLDGVLFDRDDRLFYVELNGCCPPSCLDAFLEALGWPDTSLVFELVREALVLDEADFRRFALSPSK